MKMVPPCVKISRYILGKTETIPTLSTDMPVKAMISIQAYTQDK
jgi:hypothetical protein